MAESFVRDGERLSGVLERVELEVVIGLMRQTHEVVAPPRAPESADPLEALLRECGLDEGDVVDVADASALTERDPALDRLVPPAHRDDEAMAAEYRRFTERGVRERKAAQLTAAIDALRALAPGRVELTRDQATSVVIALTDVRLLVGERLGLREDEDTDRLTALAQGLDPSDPLVLLLSYYDFLTWLQDMLLGALMEEDAD